MLDQNTDRMWYVIGAVLVGAAIILIANSLFPSMFKNITGAFDEAITKGIGSDGLGGLTVNGPGSFINLIR